MPRKETRRNPEGSLLHHTTKSFSTCSQPNPKKRNPPKLQGFSHANFALVLEKLLFPIGIPNSVD